MSRNTTTQELAGQHHNLVSGEFLWHYDGVRRDAQHRSLPVTFEGQMSSGNLGAKRARTRLTPEQAAEELAELIRDLHELLGSYAPSWYTEDLDTRVFDTLAKYTQSRKTSQETKPRSGGHR
jgi:hypothetical protein